MTLYCANLCSLEFSTVEVSTVQDIYLGTLSQKALNVYLFQDKLLSKLEESEPELAACQEEEGRPGLVDWLSYVLTPVFPHVQGPNKYCNRAGLVIRINEVLMEYRRILEKGKVKLESPTIATSHHLSNVKLRLSIFIFDHCVICINAKATMQTAPCGHQVVCRKCFVKTIQIAVSQRLLPLSKHDPIKLPLETTFSKLFEV
ncbi:hypothetical protein NQ318_021787 [Aromia moschata]|uniref:RING-type domain-containing protein n=1 Tax=Aromia moschata TaxID=1265417 RepID=A0AAV8Z7R7_9CUCU|nr:hypothetical protein NQ318_021787 [Aromia moschata]